MTIVAWGTNKVSTGAVVPSEMHTVTHVARHASHTMVADSNAYLLFIMLSVCASRLVHGFTTDGTFAEYAVS